MSTGRAQSRQSKQAQAQAVTRGIVKRLTRTRTQRERATRAIAAIRGPSQLSERVTFGDGDDGDDQTTEAKSALRIATSDYFIGLSIGQLEVTRAHVMFRPLLLYMSAWN